MEAFTEADRLDHCFLYKVCSIILILGKTDRVAHQRCRMVAKGISDHSPVWIEI